MQLSGTVELNAILPWPQMHPCCSSVLPSSWIADPPLCGQVGLESIVKKQSGIRENGVRPITMPNPGGQSGETTTLGWAIVKWLPAPTYSKAY